MAIHARPFSDPRNTYIVDNNDPGAFDKTHAGTPGTHTEQRCCEDKAPTRAVEGTGWYVNEKGQRIVKVIEFWSRPENRAGANDGWWNAETPPGLYIEMAPTGMLMCDGCFGSIWDQFMDDLSSTFDEMVPVVRGIAMAMSYIPVFGTAVSFILNASVSLAQGARVDSAVLDGVGTALPGQPMSGAAFSAARSLIRGDTIDKAAIFALPVDESVKEIISTTVDIAVAVAEGQRITDVALDQFYARLPDEGKKAVDIARRIAQGENVGDMVVDEAMQAAVNIAKSQGQEAINRYAAQAGFQAALDTLDPMLQNALYAGLIAGNSEKHQFIGTFDYSEKNVISNDAMAAKGQQIIASGAKWRGRLLSDIRAASTFTFTHNALDALSGTMQRRTDVYDITDQWRRGFDVAIGVCDGSSEDGPGQQQVKLSLGAFNVQQGFDVGQEIQHQRTLGDFIVTGITDNVSATNLHLAALKDNPAPLPPIGQTLFESGNAKIQAELNQPEPVKFNSALIRYRDGGFR